MLIALLYHKINAGKYSNSLEMLDAHLQFIASRMQTVHPGEKLPKGLSVCLTFDDAFFDFYHLIFPMLKKYNLKALLAVPTAYIPDQTSLTPLERLEKIKTFPDKAPPVPSPAFCTWPELKELAKSPLIHIASHSVHHRPLTSPHIDKEYELTASKKLLEEKLQLSITSFVYPFGRFNRKAHALAKKHYSHIFRIGNALNLSWKNTNSLLYRINGDALPSPRYPFALKSHLKHGVQFAFNTIRKK
ncbi:MAG: polysaccharide deacetylase family protein [Chlamydiia bacterium]|nr:polysaccharide deacetylase family protein [Chlamydiia bacterium]